MSSRLYFDESMPAEVNPPFDAGWAAIGSAVRRMMVQSQRVGDAIANGAAIASTAGQNALHRQYVSPCMVAGNKFASGITSAKIQVMGFESAINDNIINRVRAARIVSRDGQTVQATMAAISSAPSVVEWNTALRNLTFANGALGATYTTVDGDRIVLELGHKDSAGTTISGTMAFGSDPAGTGDLGENETDTTATLRAWFQIDNLAEGRPEIEWERADSGLVVPQAVQRAGRW
jgi:hypothetical protein